MKLGTMAAIAGLALAMTLGGTVTPADAGDKSSKKQAHKAGKVHIDPNVSTKNLRAVEKKLKGHHKQAVSDELERRRKTHRKNEAAKVLGELIAESPDAAGQILGLGIWGTESGKRRKSGH